MTPDERQNRWVEIEQQFQKIAEGKVVADDPAATEASLLTELDELEWEAGQEFFGSGANRSPQHQGQPMLTKIVSVGQTGVDRAALDLALELGFPCGGWCPKGRKAEDGPLPAPLPADRNTDRQLRGKNKVERP